MPPLLLLALLAATSALDINTADDAALRGAGFSASQAAQIVRYRTENGAFLQVDELLAVPQVSRAALAPLRQKLTLGAAAPAAAAPVAVAGAASVRVQDVTAEWRNLYGVIVYAVNATLENTGDKPVRAVHVRLDLLDAGGAVVASGDGYNLGAEVLTADPKTAVDTLPAIAPKASDKLRLTIDKTEIPQPFVGTRLTVVETR